MYNVFFNRSAAPINGFMILNRLGMNDQIEPINKNLEFQLQDPFLLYRNAQGVYVPFMCSVPNKNPRPLVIPDDQTNFLTCLDDISSCLDKII